MTIFAEKMKFAEFYAGKGKDLNEVKVPRESEIKTHIFEYAHMLRV